MKKRGNQKTNIQFLKKRNGGFLISVMAFLVLMVQLSLPLAPLFAYEDGEEIVTVSEPSIVNEPQEASPAVEANADEVESAETPSMEETNELPSEPVTEEEKTGDGLNLDSVPDPVEENEVPIVTSTSSVEELVLPDATSSLVVTGSTTPVENEESAPVMDEETGSTTPPLETVIDEVSGSTTPVENEEPGPVIEDEPALPSDGEEEVSTSTLPVTVEQPEVHTVTNDENRFSFGVNDCAQVADGSFYCKKAEAEPKVIEEDRVFAGPDKDGDKEIFIEHNGELTQITFNLEDDEAPYFDPESNTIVWHRLIDGRYQIVSYDIEEEEETVLTHDHYNNMQPSRTGEITVWQGWVGNDWEILLMEDGEISMITDNTVHDIGPYINGDFIIWQAEEPEGWKVRVYNRLTHETETISDAEGASIENPRLVLLYDAKSQNGDVETRGYDLISGETVPLGSVPHGAPEDIPDPDQTGEDRALITGSTQLKTKTEDEGEPLPEADNASSSPPIVIDPTDIIIPSQTPSDVTATETGTSSPTTTEDLIIPALPNIEIDPPIEDLVIPSFPVEVESEVLPQ